MKQSGCLIFFFLTLYKYYNACQATPITGANVRFAKPGEYSFVVSIAVKFFEKEIHYCGGSLITRKHVLTSATCRDNELLSIYVVRVGSADVKTAERYTVKSWIIYDEWARANSIISEKIYNDISILKLSCRISSSINLARITRGFSTDFYGLQAQTAVWGYTHSLPIRKYLKVADLNVLSHEEFVANFEKTCNTPYRAGLDMNLLGTNSNPPTALESDDIGSPLFINGNEIIGINISVESVLNTTCVLINQNLHMAIDYYRDFIKDISECKTNCIIG